MGRVLVIAAVVLVAACGGGTVDTGGGESASTSSVPTSTSAAEPGSVPPTGTATSAPTTTAPTSDLLASGSGCTPGTDGLPDGEWFGYVVAATTVTLEFDLACWFSGEAAVVAAAEGGEESPPPNDYHIRNENPILRTIDVSPTVEVFAMTNVGDPATVVPMAYADWVALRVDGAERPMDVWIVVVDGAVASITEQYRP